MSGIIRIDTISDVHERVGYGKPMHPLITVIYPSKIRVAPVVNQRFSIGLYSISLKHGNDCRIRYGRQQYDFQEGTLMFLAPDQIIEPVGETEEPGPDADGWALVFHPDLIRRSQLGRRMHEYSFFSYESHEALHLSDAERQTVTGIVKAIEHEYRQNIDVFSHELIISNIELLLNHCKRFYGRQFITRTNANKDVVARFESFLKTYFESDKPETAGLPSVKYCAREMGYSPNYLSDLLRKETGKNAQEHIHFCLIEKAKTMLLGTEEPVYRIAQSLGFEYPQHFSKLFKNKTGLSPAEYRN